jgi:CRP-like cAMP-binding protein
MLSKCSFFPKNVVSLKPEFSYQEWRLFSYSTGTRIPLCDQEVCIIRRGFAQTQILHPEGDESILGLVGPMMSFSSSFTSFDSYEVYALSPVDLIRLSWSEIQSSAVLMQELNHMMIQRLRHADALLALKSARQTIDRLIGFLSFLSQEYGHPTSQGIRLEIQLTHKQIANIINATRVTTTRLIGMLKKASLIKIGPNRCLYIMDELFENHALSFLNYDAVSDA